MQHKMPHHNNTKITTNTHHHRRNSGSLATSLESLERRRTSGNDRNRAGMRERHTWKNISTGSAKSVVLFSGGKLIQQNTMVGSVSNNLVVSNFVIKFNQTKRSIIYMGRTMETILRAHIELTCEGGKLVKNYFLNAV